MDGWPSGKAPVLKTGEAKVAWVRILHHPPIF